MYSGVDYFCKTLDIIGVSQGYEYASNKTKQKLGALPFISPKIRTAIAMKISFTFKFIFIFTLLTCGDTLLITNSIHVPLISN